jgi:hypothetical protein
MSAGPFTRLLPLAAFSGDPDAVASPTTPTNSADVSPTTPSSAEVGSKAERLGAALRAGLPVLPGFVVPATEARPALQAAASAVRAHGIAAGRPEVLRHSIDSALTEELPGGWMR